MMHITEDDLLALTLDTLDDPAAATRITDHLRDCPECRARMQRIRADLEIIASVRPEAMPVLMPPRIRHVFARSLVRAAALLVLGFAAGYASSRLVQNAPAHVTPAYDEGMSPDANNSAPGDATALDVSAR